MSKLRESLPAKIALSALMLLLVFLTSFQGLMVLRGLQYMEAEGWQDTGQFVRLIRNWANRTAGLLADRAALEGEGLSYLDRQQYESSVQQAETALNRENTVFRYEVRSQDGQPVAETNLTARERLEDLAQTVSYGVFELGHYYVEFNHEVNWDQAETTETGEVQNPVEAAPGYVLACGVPEELEPDGPHDGFWELYLEYGVARRNFPWQAGSAGLCLLLAIVCLGLLMASCGYKKGSGETSLSWQERIPFDVYLFLDICLFALCMALMWEFANLLEYEGKIRAFRWLAAAISLCLAGLAGTVVLALRTFAVRCKAHALAQTTLICQICGWLWRSGVELIRAVPLIWRALTMFLGYLLLCFLARSLWGYNPIPLFLVNTATLLWLCHWTICFQRIRKGSEAIAGGNLNHQIDTTRMPHDLRLHAEALNNISQGLTGAVEEKMKSERFKAELITNVSHDLKTPLTSIINYVNLLKMEPIENPKAQEYIEVLDRKSQRLKKLTEDLVEASKASTGSLAVNREKIGMSQLVDQALGEYEEKLEARNLTVVKSLPDGEAYVYADGRHLWRVIDNLLGNCAKYAMEGTRIYLELTRGKGQVVLSVKNISRDPLNVPPERLMERFVRGEESRTTEGSGLGLSIARSLTELQGGAFSLSVDGDLFKAVVTMPQSG